MMSKSRKEKLIWPGLNHSAILIGKFPRVSLRCHSCLTATLVTHSQRQEDSFVLHEDETGAATDQAVSWVIFAKP